MSDADRPDKIAQVFTFASKKWGIQVMRIFDIPIYIHYFFFLLFVIDFINAFRFGGDAFLWMMLFFIVDGLLFASVLLHELAHCLAAKAVKGKTDYILLWPLGGMAYVGYGGGSKSQFIVAVAGPLVHVPLLVLATVMIAAADDHPVMAYYADIEDNFGKNILQGFFMIQVSMLVFNLLIPAFPLDGARIFSSMLMQLFDDKVKTARAICYMSIPIGVAMIIWGAVSSLMMIGLLGLWVLVHTWRLWNAIGNNRLDTHPLFLAYSNDPESATPTEPTASNSSSSTAGIDPEVGYTPYSAPSPYSNPAPSMVPGTYSPAASTVPSVPPPAQTYYSPPAI